MLNLIRRDFIASGLVLLGLGGLWVFQGLTVFRFNLLVLLSGVITVLLPITFFAMDARYNADLQSCSLPVLRSTIVYARYVTSLVLTMAGLMMTLLLGVTFRALFSAGGSDLRVIMSWPGAIGFVLSVILMHALFFPFIFRSGLSRGAVQFSVALVLVVAMLTGIEYLISLKQGYALFEQTPFIGLFGVVEAWARAIGAVRFRVLMVFLTMGVVLSSIRLSVRFYRQRDL